MREPLRRRTKLGLVFAVALIAVGVASSAEAATLATGPASRINYTGQGEANNLVVTADASNYIFTDTGAAITPTAPCVPTGAGASCPRAGITSLSIATNGGNDSVTLNLPSDVPTTVSTTIATADGNDKVVGSFLRDNITLGPGSDIVDTGGGPDQTIDGGEGPDTVTFANRPANVDVEAELRFGITSDGLRLRQHTSESINGTVIGGVKNLGAFENIIGGRGNDVLIGDEFDNVLIGGPYPNNGADVMCGSLGSDTVDYSGAALAQYGLVVPGAPQGVNATLEGTTPSDPRSATVDPAARQDCRQIDEASIRGDSYDPRVKDANGNVVHPPDCTADDGVPGEGDCIGDDIENVIGTPFNDVLVGNNPDPLYGGGPRVEPSGINHLEGGGGDDVLDGLGGPDVLDGGAGNDTVTYGSRTEPIKASLDGAANDGGIGDLNPAYPDAAQADSIGTDVENLTGGAGNDLLRGDDNANVLNGGDGSDTVLGNGGTDAISGGTGDDDLSGGEDKDTMNGGPGSDTLDGGFGADAMAGGDGSDLVDYSNEISSVFASADGAADDGSAGEGDNVGTDVESLTGSPSGDVLFGGAGPGTISGGAGDDVMAGSYGGDVFSGGDGIDTVSYYGRSAPVFVNLEAGGGAGEAGENDVVGGDVERLIGGDGSDKLTGNGGTNILIGNGGNDTLSGSGGPDSIFGGPGNDTVNGDDGNDSLWGDVGNDKLFGGGGSDREDGGGGDDALDGGLGSDVLSGGPGMDAAVYTSRSKDVDADVRGADNSGEQNEGDQIRLSVEGARTGSGDDSINIRDGGTGQATCGKGIDVVMADPSDDVAGDCEQVNVLASGRCSVRTKSATMSSKGTVSIRLTCPVAAKGRLRLVGAGATLGSKSFSLKAGKSRTLKLKLTKKGRRVVKRKKRLKASATVKPARRGKVAVKSTTKRLTIRAPKGKR